MPSQRFTIETGGQDRRALLALGPQKQTREATPLWDDPQERARRSPSGWFACEENPGPLLDSKVIEL